MSIHIKISRGVFTFMRKLLGGMCCVISIFLIFVFSGKSYPSEDIIRHVQTDKKMIALTFDDGPTRFTPQILDILRDNQVKGTFFCIGEKVLKNPNFTKRIVMEKHEIGNHTYTHPRIGWVGSRRQKIEIEKTQNVIYSIIGIRTKLFRSPGGRYNPGLLKVVKDTGHQMILWSGDRMDSGDWRRPGVRSIIKKVVKNANNGDIVLFHDTQAQTVKAIRQLIPILKKEGFKMVTVSELLKERVKRDEK